MSYLFHGVSLRLASQLVSVTDVAPEPWVALGYFCMATRKTTRAVYFAKKVATSLSIITGFGGRRISEVCMLYLEGYISQHEKKKGWPGHNSGYI